MTTSIEAALAQAKEAAANAVPQTVEHDPTPAPAPIQRGAPLTIADGVQSSGMSVDYWLKTDKSGHMTLAGKKGFFQKARVLVDMSAVRTKKSVRYGKPPRYVSTYDGYVSTNGKPWPEELALAMRADPDAYEYICFDIPMTLLEDLVAIDGKTVLANAGEVIGKTTSPTERKPFLKLITEIGKLGHEAVPDNPKGTYQVTITCEGVDEPGKQYGKLILSDPQLA